MVETSTLTGNSLIETSTCSRNSLVETSTNLLPPPFFVTSFFNKKTKIQVKNKQTRPVWARKTSGAGPFFWNCHTALERQPCHLKGCCLGLSTAWTYLESKTSIPNNDHQEKYLLSNPISLNVYLQSCTSKYHHNSYNCLQSAFDVFIRQTKSLVQCGQIGNPCSPWHRPGQRSFFCCYPESLFHEDGARKKKFSSRNMRKTKTSEKHTTPSSKQ